jgi:hypothetical protein
MNDSYNPHFLTRHILCMLITSAGFSQHIDKEPQIIESVISVKCRTAIKKKPFLHFNLCQSVNLDSLSCAFTCISFFTKRNFVATYVNIHKILQPLAGLFTYVDKPYICTSMFIFLWMTYDMHLYVLSLLVILHIMLVKSPLGLVLYCYFNMPTYNNKW